MGRGTSFCFLFVLAVVIDLSKLVNKVTASEGRKYEFIHKEWVTAAEVVVVGLLSRPQNS